MTTMTESFFKENFNETLADISDYVKITAANGLQIPFIGYYETTIKIFGREVREAGFLIVKDPEDLYLASRKHAVPGVVGSNIFNVLANNPARSANFVSQKMTTRFFCQYFFLDVQ